MSEDHLGKGVASSEGEISMWKLPMIIIAVSVVAGALLYGLSSPNKRDSGLAGAYDKCKVQDGRRVQLVFTCPDRAAFLAAMGEFAKRNPGRKIESMSVWFN